MSDETKKRSDPASEGYVKIIAYNEVGEGERFWAIPLGNSLYEVQSIVVNTYGESAAVGRKLRRIGLD